MPQVAVTDYSILNSVIFSIMDDIRDQFTYKTKTSTGKFVSHVKTQQELLNRKPKTYHDIMMQNDKLGKLMSFQGKARDEDMRFMVEAVEGLEDAFYNPLLAGVQGNDLKTLRQLDEFEADTKAQLRHVIKEYQREVVEGQRKLRPY